MRVHGMEANARSNETTESYHAYGLIGIAQRKPSPEVGNGEVCVCVCWLECISNPGIGERVPARA